ncbi:hypothetical protein E3E38_09475 [Thermococcus sp. 18S1]|uniref:hypothetical protein n=1 Tax=Thermococcus sp. 18S1 TaxID=1638210 RepID=UPI00143B7DFE|nr:hypothetical protein [Thermococcus sp. 18S1]NJE31269.1 hypothetical protein [Thermococcus sp. 18S1]
MRNVIPSMLVAVFVLIGGLHSALAAPYWAKPGVYVEYAALTYEPYVQYKESLGVKERPMTMILFYNHSGALFNIHATGDVFLAFRIDSDNGTHLEVAFRLTAHNVTVDVILENGTDLPAFWDESEVVSFSTRRAGWSGVVEYKIAMKSLEITGSYHIRKRDGAVIGLDGRTYGHTFLWYDPTEDIGDIPYVNLTPVAPSLYLNGTVGIDKKLVTYHDTFGPPIGRVVLVQRNPGPIQVCFFAGDRKVCPFGTGGDEIVGGFTYDPASGITLAGDMLIPPADIRTAGIVYALFSDLKGCYLNEVKADYSVYPVLQLYDTNADLGTVEEVQFNRERTPWEYAFYVLLVILGIALMNAFMGVHRQ